MFFVVICEKHPNRLSCCFKGMHSFELGNYSAWKNACLVVINSRLICFFLFFVFLV